MSFNTYQQFQEKDFFRCFKEAAEKAKEKKEDETKDISMQSSIPPTGCSYMVFYLVFALHPARPAYILDITVSWKGKNNKFNFFLKYQKTETNH